jgi:hypothetical protein
MLISDTGSGHPSGPSGGEGAAVAETLDFGQVIGFGGDRGGEAPGDLFRGSKQRVTLAPQSRSSTRRGPAR